MIYLKAQLERRLISPKHTHKSKVKWLYGRRKKEWANKVQLANLTLSNVRDVFILIFVAVCAWKLLDSSLSFNLSNLDIQGILNLLLALFSVGLSVAFYFKANETSNMFYDNVYKFTKDVSEILGRIEAGFGESLRNLDRGYSSVRDRMDRISNQIHVEQENVDEKQEDVDEVKRQQDKLISELLDKAKVTDEERRMISSELEKTSRALEQKSVELLQAQSELKNLQAKSDTVSRRTYSALARHVMRKIFDILPSNIDDMSLNQLRLIFTKAVNEVNLSSRARFDLIEASAIDPNNEITAAGVRLLLKAYTETKLGMKTAADRY